jgi:ABC-type microcin C transport system duplicated ATPase subunit YejF
MTGNEINLLTILSLFVLTACSQSESQNNSTQKAGQPLNPLETASKVAGVRAAAFAGDQDAVQAGVRDITDDFKKSIKLADPTKSVDREMARAAAKSVSGVRSSVWFDRENLFAIVEKNEQKSYETIDAICMKLEPLGDTLGVVVNLQSGAATTGNDLEILSRNCQLAPGDRAMFQKNRQIDVISPEIREQHKANNAR